MLTARAQMAALYKTLLLSNSNCACGSHATVDGDLAKPLSVSSSSALIISTSEATVSAQSTLQLVLLEII